MGRFGFAHFDVDLFDIDANPGDYVNVAPTIAFATRTRVTLPGELLEVAEEDLAEWAEVFAADWLLDRGADSHADPIVTPHPDWE